MQIDLIVSPLSYPVTSPNTCSVLQMAALLQIPHFLTPPSSITLPKSSKSQFFCVNFTNNISYPKNKFLYSHKGVPKFSVLASSNDVIEPVTETDTDEVLQPQHPDILDNTDGGVNGETSEDASSGDGKPDIDESPTSPVLTALHLYKEAINNNDEAKVSELEAFFKSIEDEKIVLKRKLASVSEDLLVERERILRIGADFDNFRKRTERERLSLVTNAQGEVIENFLPVLDNFERAKSQIKAETEAEQKINNSYQSIYKQFFEILCSIGVLHVETIGKPFDPMLHEAIMRDESTEYDDGIVIEEYRKGFQLGDRLLRPSMVKVSAGPGPAKPETSESTTQEEGGTETSEILDEEADSGNQATS